MADAAPLLAVTRAGAGAPLVLVHGYFGGAAHWTDQIEALAPHRDVIAVNLAGFGDSAHLSAPDTIEGHAAQVWATLDALGVGDIDLLGHSMGGMVVQQMAVMAPGRVGRLILYGTGPVGALPGRFETIAQSRARLLADGCDATMRRIAARWFVDEDAAPGYARCVAEGAKATEQAALASLTAWEGWNGTAALASIRARTLVIWGAHDRSYPIDQPQALCAGISDATLQIMPGCGHAAHMEQAEEFNRLLYDFLGTDFQLGMKSRAAQD